MLQKQAILYVEKITCTKTTGEAGDDDIWLRITVDGNVSYYPSDESRYHFKKDGGTQYVDLTINVTYVNTVKFELIEYDSSSENEWIGSHTLTRGSTDSSPESRTVDMDADGKTSGEYTLTYRIISDPIPTLRVLGIRCEQQSAGMNVDLVEKIISVASDVTDKAGNVIKKSPRPRAKTIGKAFEAASEVLEAMADLGEWIGRIIEGQHDEVYMKHVESSRGYNGAPFPPDKNFELMKSGDDIYIEEKYGQYLRFPLDRGPVTLELREHDGGKADVNIGTLTIAPDSLGNNSSAGISGTTVNGGVAVMDGPAVVELASMYGNREGEGALYHICYSVGFEDWCKPATPEGQGEGGKPESGKTYSMVAKHSGKVITVSGDGNAAIEDGANILQSEHVGSAKQRFLFHDIGGGYYSFTAWHSGKAIHGTGSPEAETANVVQWENVGSNRQLFQLEPQDDGYYIITCQYSRKALSVDGQSQEDGANILLSEFREQDSQLFRFELEE